MSDNFQTDPVLEVCQASGLLDSATCDEIMSEHLSSGKSIRDLIVDGSYVTEDDLLNEMAAYHSLEVATLQGVDILPEILKVVPGHVARMYNVIPVEITDTSVTLACDSIQSPIVSDELHFVLSRDIFFVLARQKEIHDCISRYYGDESSALDNFMTGLSDFEELTGKEDVS